MRLLPGSPGVARGPPKGSPHVWFNKYNDSQHDITPYAEIYGVHPRLFNFNEQGDMVPPSPLTKWSKSIAQFSDVHIEEDDPPPEEGAKASSSGPTLETTPPKANLQKIAAMYAEAAAGKRPRSAGLMLAAHRGGA
jgi:hypothetical protein